jgi:hypothetical protein
MAKVLDPALQDYFNQICCTTPTVTYNFDVDSSDWAGTGITDQASFDSVLGVTTSDFLLSGNNIKATITSLPTVKGKVTLSLNSKSITNVNYITVVNLETLNLNNNQIATFNPILSLPSSLQDLYLGYNQLIIFNPTIALPSSLEDLEIVGNQMTLASYTASESWANGMHTAPSGGVISFTNNIDSVAGTNLETILVNKGWTVNV